MNNNKEKLQADIENRHKMREKQLLQLKASNEMLEEAKETVRKHYGDDSDSINLYIEQIENAQKDNARQAKELLNADLSEADNMKYHQVNPREVKHYYDRLKRQGKSEETIRMKNIEPQLKEYEQSSESKRIDENKPKSKLGKLLDTLQGIRESVKSNNNTKQVEPSENEISDNPNQTENSFDEVTATEQVKEPVSFDNVEIIKDRTYPDFDPRDIPSNIQYDMIPLPSKGECYAHKKSMLPVAYLTASDEDLITSQNMYTNGSMIDIILERKILDRSIRVSELCKGDRDAITIWLRATAYGPKYPVVANYNGNEIESIVDLNDIHYLDFNLKGDENGWFTYTTGTNDIIKYKVLTHGEESELFEHNKLMGEVTNRLLLGKYMDMTTSLINKCDGNGKDEIIEAISLIKEWAYDSHIDDNKNINPTDYVTYITDKMYKHTMSVNGNTDRNFIRQYVDNMIAKEALAYRNYINEHIPGVNLNVTIPIPESLGGGSFETFLSIGETVFINV